MFYPSIAQCDSILHGLCCCRPYNSIRAPRTSIFSVDNHEICKNPTKILQNDESNNLSLIIQSYELKERKTYGGNALRALESEIKGEIRIVISNGEDTITKKLVVVKNYSVSELNPLSERETVKKLEQAIQAQLINQIAFEVRLLEM